mmetsp:Transcript_25294/g.38950  ORF Transcript_25294/g.38950 Transcript_25294/m.38950 type:complete len:118 (-) Transcript_25294:310-663(-)
MHPPLNRPHPECQNQIDKLQECHATKRFWNLSACNIVKRQLDDCFKKEKENLLKSMNKDMMFKRQQEEDSFADAVGHKETFEEYLARDQDYQKACQDNQDGSKDKNYQTKSMGGRMS